MPQQHRGCCTTRTWGRQLKAIKKHVMLIKAMQAEQPNLSWAHKSLETIFKDVYNNQKNFKLEKGEVDDWCDTMAKRLRVMLRHVGPGEGPGEHDDQGEGPGEHDDQGESEVKEEDGDHGSLSVGLELAEHELTIEEDGDHGSLSVGLELANDHDHDIGVPISILELCPF
jgi:hypothetical protein